MSSMWVAGTQVLEIEPAPASQDLHEQEAGTESLSHAFNAGTWIQEAGTVITDPHTCPYLLSSLPCGFFFYNHQS